MFNLNEKYFSISERCGRNHQNKFCLRSPKRRLCTWELSQNLIRDLFQVFADYDSKQLKNFQLFLPKSTDMFPAF